MPIVQRERSQRQMIAKSEWNDRQGNRRHMRCIISSGKECIPTCFQCLDKETRNTPRPLFRFLCGVCVETRRKTRRHFSLFEWEFPCSALIFNVCSIFCCVRLIVWHVKCECDSLACVLARTHRNPFHQVGAACNANFPMT